MLNERTYHELTELGGQDWIPSLVDTDREGALSGSDDGAREASANYRTQSITIGDDLEAHYGECLA